jgi:serine/threonine protein kinase
MSENRKMRPENQEGREFFWSSQHPGEISDVADVTPAEHHDISRSHVPSVPRLLIDSAEKSKDPMQLPVGDVYGDFFIRREIGRGAFGVVYQAEQVSLARTVALKVTDTTRENGCCAEGQTMAQLEHPSIVRVFAQLTDDTNHRRMLCMQYVSGINLRSLMKMVRESFGDQWNGINLLQILEEDGNEEDLVLSATAVADRATLISTDKLGAVCWIGAQAALALDHAHQAGYIHHDVKPENTIVNRFGRPMLVDFNLAMESSLADHRLKGGTVPYMPPESIRDIGYKNVSRTANAFNADVYALGVTLWELSCGSLPFPCVGAEAFRDPDRLKELLKSRQAVPPSDGIHTELAKCLQRSFCYDPAKRFRSATEFGEALLGVAQQNLATQSRSEKSWLVRLVLQRPAFCILAAGFAPHVVASGFQIAYNQAAIISRLTPAANNLFNILLFCANPVIYGFCAWFVVKYLFAVLKPWQRLRQGDHVDSDEVFRARQNLMMFPRTVAVIGAVGWFAGMVGFPGSIYLLAQHFPGDVWLHFLFSFAISGAIAVTFSYTLVLAIAIYSIYPALFAKPSQFIAESRRQLEPIRANWSMLSIYAGLIPLVAAILVVANMSPSGLLPTDDNPYRETAFKGLVIGLIVASALGFEFVRRIGKSVVRLINICVGGSGV